MTDTRHVASPSPADIAGLQTFVREQIHHLALLQDELLAEVRCCLESVVSRFESDGEADGGKLVQSAINFLAQSVILLQLSGAVAAAMKEAAGIVVPPSGDRKESE